MTEVKPGRGRKRTISAAQVKAIITATTQTTPPGATQWSTRTMAEAFGVSTATVARIWQAHGLQPHRVRPFKVSRDTHFTEKLTDVVGLYLNPPDKALVLCVDEKSQIQALDRTQPGLPIKKGRAGTLTHDYKRNGTTTLFAALNMLDGTVIGSLPAPPSERGVSGVPPAVGSGESAGGPRAAPDRGQLRHAQTSQRPGVVGKHPRFHLHFTPTSSSLAEPRRTLVPRAHHQGVRRGVFQSVADLIAAIEEYIAIHNPNTRSPSSGRSPPRRSWRRWVAVKPFWQQYTSSESAERGACGCARRRRLRWPARARRRAP